MDVETKFIDRYINIRRALWFITILVLAYIQVTMIVLDYDFWLMVLVCAPIYIMILFDIVRIEIPMEK